MPAMTDAVRDLVHDHGELNRRVRAVAAALLSPGLVREAPSKPLLADLVELREALFLHFAREEEGLFPFVAEVAPSSEPQVAAMATAHDTICGSLARVVHLAHGGATLGTIAPLFERFQAAYAAHAEREAELLRALDASLTPAQRARLAALVEGL